MKRLITALALLSLCAVLLGAAPMMPTREYFVNDAAGIIIDEHKADMMSVSAWLQEQSGAELVVLTVQSLEDMRYDDINEFADVIFKNWGVGGREDENGLLIVADKAASECTVKVGKRFAGEITPAQVNAAMESVTSTMKKGNSTKALMDLYQALALRVCEIAGLELPVGSDGAKGSLDNRTASYIIMVGVFLVLIRSMRVSYKYRKRFGGGRIRKRRTFSRSQYDDGMREIKEMPERFNRIGREPTSGDDS